MLCVRRWPPWTGRRTWTIRARRPLHGAARWHASVQTFASARLRLKWRCCVFRLGCTHGRSARTQSTSEPLPPPLALAAAAMGRTPLRPAALRAAAADGLVAAAAELGGAHEVVACAPSAERAGYATVSSRSQSSSIFSVGRSRLLSAWGVVDLASLLVAVRRSAWWRATTRGTVGASSCSRSSERSSGRQPTRAASSLRRTRFGTTVGAARRTRRPAAAGCSPG